ncbi:MAG TPA: POTRA domain-containing protein, partial [Elusimicrobiales bacterium]|nr:POTRA domain-containing protein [Elusimicrobiales bacterium]
MSERSPALRAVISLLLLAPSAGVFALPAAPEPGAVRIERIVITGNRTSEKVLRRRLPFSEGDALGPDALKEARTALWDMRQFKKVEVSSSSAPGGGAEVLV